MMCGKMIEANGRMVPCGQCMPCRINLKRMWTGRILLEQAHTPNDSSFVTLTYDEDNLPDNRTLVKKDAQMFMDRLRKRTGVGRVRYFLVGEYGDKTWRPHYHVALFGVPPDPYEDLIQECWKVGYIHIGLVEKRSAAYVANYCTKKMTKGDDSRLRGREPEFALMSKNPPLGAAGVRHIFDLLHTKAGCAALKEYQDVPNSFRVFGKEYPLGQYWVAYLRQELGVTNPPVNSTWNLDYETFTRKQEQAEKVAIKLWARKGKLKSGRGL